MFTFDSVPWINRIDNKLLVTPALTDELKEITLEVYWKKWIEFFNTKYLNGPFLKSSDYLVSAITPGKYIVKTKANILDIKLTFSIKDSKLFVFVSKIKHLQPTEHLDYFKNEIASQISKICSDLNNPLIYSHNDFIADVFDSLLSRGLTLISGEDLKNIIKINNNANKYFPYYSALPIEKRVNILGNSFKKFRKISYDFDFYEFSKILVFNLIKNHLVTKLVWFDEYSKPYYYNLISYQFKSVINEETGKLERKPSLVTSLKYKSANSCVTKTITPFDLWSLLAN